MKARKSFAKRVFGRLGAFALRRITRRYERKTVAQAEASGARLGKLLYKYSSKHRLYADRNLRLAFPEKTDDERNAIMIGAFAHFGLIAGDFLHSLERTDEEVIAGVEVEGMDHAERALGMKMGVIAATGHFGNWERFGHWFKAKYSEKITVVSRDADDPLVEDQIRRIREHAGMEIISRGSSTRALVRFVKAGGTLGLLYDQNSEETYIPFFGKPCGTVLGPAKLQRLTGSPILPAYCVRVGVGRYRMIFKPLIMPGDFETDEEIMIALNAALESVVREYPDQWLWFHDRWKSAREQGLV